MDVLLLCTANQCRSPMAEVLLRRHLERAGIPATISSAGIWEGGQPATTYAMEVMQDRGLDLHGHRSRQVSHDLLERADLVIGMTREHVREAAVLHHDVLRRAFTLKELVRMGTGAGARHQGEALDAWLTRAGADRRRTELIGVGIDPALDVADPIGRSRDEFEATAVEIDGLLARLVALAWPTTNHEKEHVS